ncbi:type 2 periplasmic-binding domain-containing protein [Paraburkholderia acidisoli]|uniref:Uncharacterized protein n=1 Tax=Paraburkholderia acidisoli TaxID=2571748 RepID=A0A7Z2JJP7_9BURK|nr:hypothetical protein [Paraburkholderia acidisoli]QGZ65570.1 hypothetical protein FAZ98_27900 [Paraburkholderia acidisoli]
MIEPQDRLDEKLITVPVNKERLDIYTRFLLPAQCTPNFHRTAEQIELMLQLVAARRGVADTRSARCGSANKVFTSRFTLACATVTKRLPASQDFLIWLVERDLKQVGSEACITAVCE